MTSRYQSILTALILALIGVLSTQCRSNAAPTQSGPEPMLWGYAFHGRPITKNQIQTAEKATGLQSNIVLFYVQWPEQADKLKNSFPDDSLEAIKQHQAIPCISWEPMYIQNDTEKVIPAESILAGDYDEYIRHYARQCRSFGNPILLRFAHEMNLQRYHWGTSEEEYGPESAELYIKMFRHIVDIFRKANAHNVLFVWCPNAESVPNTSFEPSAGWNIAENYYPGKDYVDIVGMDGYNWGDTQTKAEDDWDSRWQAMEEIFRPLYTQIQQFAPSKPVLICEFASATSGGDRRKWFAAAVKAIQSWNLEGAVWFQANSELDWRLDKHTVGQSPRVQPMTPEDAQQWAREITDGQK